MESEFESYDNLPNGWVYLFQVGEIAGRVCGAEQTDRLHVQSPLLRFIRQRVFSPD